MLLARMVGLSPWAMGTPGPGFRSWLKAAPICLGQGGGEDRQLWYLSKSDSMSATASPLGKNSRLLNLQGTSPQEILRASGYLGCLGGFGFHWSGRGEGSLRQTGVQLIPSRAQSPLQNLPPPPKESQRCASRAGRMGETLARAS